MFAWYWEWGMQLSMYGSACSCKSHTWACQYTGIYRVFQGVHRSREPGCDKRGVNDTYIDTYHYSACGERCHDQCGAHSGSPQLLVTPMYHYNSVLLLQITICNDIGGEHNSGATLQNCSGAWVWLIIILVIISCTDLFLYFLHLFSNFIQLVPVLFTLVQLCTF